ncbi:MAG: FliO/MopB family protein [Sedimentisphaerales bacterium]|nr:FliO/MopB family protein [Sedimentisphaerales bacterium]
MVHFRICRFGTIWIIGLVLFLTWIMSGAVVWARVSANAPDDNNAIPVDAGSAPEPKVLSESDPDISPVSTDTAPDSLDKGISNEYPSREILSDFESRPIGKGSQKQNQESATLTATPARSVGQSPSAGWVMVSLIIVLVLISMTAWLFRRLTLGTRHSRGNNAIEILSRNPIGPKQTLCLVKLGGRLLLVGLSPNHMASLLAVDDPEEITMIMGLLEQHTPQSISNTFNRLFRSESQTYESVSDYQQDEPREFNEYPSRDEFGSSEPSSSRSWSSACSEISSLLNKVKGLTRLHIR